MNRIDELLKRKRLEVEQRKANQPGIAAGLRSVKRQPFLDKDRFHVIAEFKRSSLSAGALRMNWTLSEAANEYTRARVSAMSVLTESNYFNGSLADLREARRATDLPILQKDFILDEFQIAEASATGADFILLIARFLSARDLHRLHEYAESHHIHSIVEITDEEDLAKIDFSVQYLGVNSRDLKTLAIDTTKFARLRNLLPDCFLIAESGISNRETLAEIIDLNYHAALIGEHFARASHPGRTAAAFVQFADRWHNTRTQTPRVKMCGITRESDALIASELGASALGFIFAESPRRIAPDNLLNFRSNLPNDILKIGVFRGQAPEQVDQIVRECNLDAAQTYETLPIAAAQWHARSVATIEEIKGQTSRNQERKILWDIKCDHPEILWKHLSRSPIFGLAGGLTPENVADAVAVCVPHWIDVARGVESSPGIKDVGRMRRFLTNCGPAKF